MNEIVLQVRQAVEQFSPNILGAVLVLVVGWLLAWAAGTITRRLLHRTELDNQLARWIAGKEAGFDLPIEAWAGRAVFIMLLLFALVAFFYTLRLPILSEPLSLIIAGVSAYLPRILAAIVLALIAWGVATLLKRIVAAVLGASKIDEKLESATGEAQSAKTPLSRTLSEALYWLVLLLFLPAILGALNMQSLLDPVTTMFNKFFAYLPQILGCAVILIIGWFVARIIQRIVGSLLASAGLDAASERWGLSRSLGQTKLSGLVGLVVFYLVLLPVIVSALNALQLEAITKPASDMLGRIANMLPSIFGALLILVISFIVGRLVAAIVSNLLAGMGFNNALVKLGLARQPREDDRSPSALTGRLVLIAILAFASVEAANLMGFNLLASILRDFIGLAGHVLLGLIIFSLGLLLANWVAGLVRASDSPNAPLLALASRVVILLLAGAMALRQMELANEIVNLAFGLAIGAVAVSVALAFGLGGRDHAARLLQEWRDRVKDPAGKSH